MSATVIEEDLTVDGNIVSSNGTINVKGKVTGDITAKAVDVAKSGHVAGAVTADHVKIDGTQSGSVKCSELALGGSSDVNAQVTAATMVSEKGARLVGEVKITG